MLLGKQAPYGSIPRGVGEKSPHRVQALWILPVSNTCWENQGEGGQEGGALGNQCYQIFLDPCPWIPRYVQRFGEALLSSWISKLEKWLSG